MATTRFAVESEQDKAVAELAYAKAACDVKLALGGCSKRQCSSCGKLKAVNSCLAQMDDYSRVAVSNRYETEYHRLYAAAFKDKNSDVIRKMKKKQRLRCAIKAWCILVGFMLFMVLVVGPLL